MSENLVVPERHVTAPEAGVGQGAAVDVQAAAVADSLASSAAAKAPGEPSARSERRSNRDWFRALTGREADAAKPVGVVLVIDSNDSDDSDDNDDNDDSDNTGAVSEFHTLCDTEWGDKEVLDLHTASDAQRAAWQEFLKRFEGTEYISFPAVAALLFGHLGCYLWDANTDEHIYSNVELADVLMIGFSWGRAAAGA